MNNNYVSKRSLFLRNFREFIYIQSIIKKYEVHIEIKVIYLNVIDINLKNHKHISNNTWYIKSENDLRRQFTRNAGFVVVCKLSL